MAENALHQKNWSYTKLFNYLFFTLAGGVFAGLGTYYSNILIFQNGLNESIIYSLIAAVSFSTVISNNFISLYSYKLESDNQ